MNKFLRSSICTFSTACLILFAVSTPHAFGGSLPSKVDTEDELIDYIYDESNKGDAGDILGWIQDYLDNNLGLKSNAQEGDDFIDSIIKKLKKNRAKLAFGVSLNDLKRISEKAKKSIDNYQTDLNAYLAGLTRPGSPSANR